MKYICSFFIIAFLLSSSSKLSAQNSELKLRYFGTAGWEITDGTVTVLVDPYISRLKLGSGPSTSSEDTRKSFKRSDYFQSDTVLINQLITKVDFILVHHSHFDHLSDVPYIAKKTGAKVIGTESTTNVLRAYGIPENNCILSKVGKTISSKIFLFVSWDQFTQHSTKNSTSIPGRYLRM